MNYRDYSGLEPVKIGGYVSNVNVNLNQKRQKYDNLFMFRNLFGTYDNYISTKQDICKIFGGELQLF